MPNDDKMAKENEEDVELEHQWRRGIQVDSYQSYPNNVSLITTVVHDARDQVEERVRFVTIRIFDAAVMNLGYHKRTMFATCVFVPILGSWQIDTKVNKRITVIRRRRLPEGVDKSIQTVLGEGRVADGNEESERTGDDGNGEEVSLSLPEVIEYKGSRSHYGILSA
jgi:hypothetical protein